MLELQGVPDCKPSPQTGNTHMDAAHMHTQLHSLLDLSICTYITSSDASHPILAPQSSFWPSLFLFLTPDSDSEKPALVKLKSVVWLILGFISGNFRIANPHSCEEMCL